MLVAGDDVVGSIDNSVHFLEGNVALHDLDGLAGGEIPLVQNCVHEIIVSQLNHVGAGLRPAPTWDQNYVCYLLACATTAANAPGSRTARSASILRLISILAFLMPCIRRL